MKTNILFLGALATLALTSCKKNDSKMASESYTTDTTITDDNGKMDTITSSSMEKTTDGQKTGSYSYPYKASDGTRAKATFTDDGKSKTILIEANNNKFQLDYKEKTPQGERYERSGISAETKGDSLIITQDNNVISLARVK